MSAETLCEYEAELELCRLEMAKMRDECTRLEKEKAELLVQLDDYDKAVRYLQGQVKAYEFAITKGGATE